MTAWEWGCRGTHCCGVCGVARLCRIKESNSGTVSSSHPIWKANGGTFNWRQAHPKNICSSVPGPLLSRHYKDSWRNMTQTCGFFELGGMEAEICLITADKIATQKLASAGVPKWRKLKQCVLLPPEDSRVRMKIKSQGFCLFLIDYWITAMPEEEEKLRDEFQICEMLINPTELLS